LVIMECPRFHHPDKEVIGASAVCPRCCLAAAGGAGGHHRSAGSARGPASLVAVLGVAVVATLAGAANYRELGLVAAGPPQELLFLLGARWDLAGLVFIAPSAGTLRRLLIALDADELDRAGERGCASTPTVTPAAGQSRWMARTCAGNGLP
jgi:hypothetical protein